jgi:hypothetical protein
MMRGPVTGPSFLEMWEDRLKSWDFRADVVMRLGERYEIARIEPMGMRDDLNACNWQIKTCQAA